MKQINVSFDDNEWNTLIDAKGDSTWRDFILKQVKGGKDNG